MRPSSPSRLSHALARMAAEAEYRRARASRRTPPGVAARRLEAPSSTRLETLIGRRDAVACRR